MNLTCHQNSTRNQLSSTSVHIVRQKSDLSVLVPLLGNLQVILEAMERAEEAEADVLLLNTCSIREKAEQTIRKRLQKYIGLDFLASSRP